MIYVALVVFQPIRDLEAGINQSLKYLQVARPGIERRTSCYASQELDHSATYTFIFFLSFLYYRNWQ